MKEVINLTGDVTHVALSTPVKTVDGVHYLLSMEEATAIAAEKADWDAKETTRANERRKTVERDALGNLGDLLLKLHADLKNGTSTFVKEVDDRLATIR